MIRPEGKKNWVVIDAQGQSHTLHPRDMVYEISGATFKPADIEAFLVEAEPYLDPSSLEVAWELLQEAEESTDPASLAMLLFSDQSPPLCYAAYRLLTEDKIYFKKKGDRFEPRPAAQVEDLLLQIQRETQRQQEWDSFVDKAKRALAGEDITWDKQDRPRLEIIERFALQGEESSQRTQAAEILSVFRTTCHSRGRIRYPSSHGVMASPRKSGPEAQPNSPLVFRRDFLAMALQRLQSPPPDPDENRLDLTHLKVYTVDDASTQEIDDGLSVETREDGQERIWIHIADPTRWLIPGDDLDLEARRRCTTVYLPTGMIPMFPAELATQAMSLIQGKTCCALSFGVCLSDSGEIEDYTIRPSLIKPTYRLTYEDVDEMLELGVKAEPELHRLAHWAQMRVHWRSDQGAISINMPESSIKVVADDDDIIIEVFDDSPARQMVAEMMILAGEVCRPLRSAARAGDSFFAASPSQNCRRTKNCCCYPRAGYEIRPFAAA